MPRQPDLLAIRLGLLMIGGLPAAQAERIVEVRGNRPFRSMEDFTQRTRFGSALLAKLSKAGVFGSLEVNRRTALWDSLAQDARELPLFGHGDSPAMGKSSPLPAMSEAEEVLADYRSLGLSLRGHPIGFLRAELDKLGAAPAVELKTRPDGKPIRVAGIVLVRQRPGTAKGITFMTLEDETGIANLIVRPAVWQRYRAATLGATLLLAHGQLQRRGEIIHVLVSKLENLSERLANLTSQSRDFC